MAAPESKTLRDLSGKWHMNKSLSGDPAPVLELQGVSLLIRKLASHAPVSLSVRQTEEDGVTQIFIDQTTTANIPAINEEWVLDWKEREQKDQLLGKVKSQSRWRKKEDIEVEWLKEGLEGEEVIEAVVVGLDRDWKAEQAWGFAVMDGERRFVRKVLTSNSDGKKIETILAYDYAS